MSGQMNFDSGWEVGYWLSDVVTARASWDPQIPPSTDEGNILDNVVDDQWEVFANSLRPATKIFGDYFGPKLTNLLVNLTRIQSEVLIHGIVQGAPSPNIHKLSGIAYLSGRDTWFEVPRLFGLHPTQPDSVGLRESDDPHWPHAQLLLQEMNELFTDISATIDLLYEDVVTYASSTPLTSLEGGTARDSPHHAHMHRFVINDAALNILYEIKDFTKLLALRSSQLRSLYQSKDPQTVGDSSKVSSLQKHSRNTLQLAAEIVQRREQYYRTPWQRIADWRDNPTVYRFTYLWAVHSLYYWWRDQGLAEQGSFQAEHSPCYLNRMDTSEVAMGWGKHTLEVFRTFINRYTPFSAGSPLEIVNCLSPPREGYQFPRDLYSFD